MKTYSIIPARGGSKGVPGKNIKLLGGYPLIAYSIAVSRLSKNIQRTIVSTDSEEIKEMALRYSAEVPFLRPKKFAKDSSPDSDFVLHAIDWFKKNEGCVPDYFVHLRPTTPLREVEIVDLAITEMKKHRYATSLRSAHPASESPFKWFLRGEDGYFKGISPEYTNEQLSLPRQDFPVVYIPDGYIDILKTSFVVESNMLHGEKLLGFVSPICHEVDTLEDFEYLEFLIQKKTPYVYEYLKSNFPSEANYGRV